MRETGLGGGYRKWRSQGIPGIGRLAMEVEGRLRGGRGRNSQGTQKSGHWLWSVRSTLRRDVGAVAIEGEGDVDGGQRKWRSKVVSGMGLLSRLHGNDRQAIPSCRQRQRVVGMGQVHRSICRSQYSSRVSLPDYCMSGRLRPIQPPSKPPPEGRSCPPVPRPGALCPWFPPDGDCTHPALLCCRTHLMHGLPAP